MIYANVTTAQMKKRRRMPRWAKIAVAVALTPLFAGMLTGTVIGIVHAVSPSTDTTVSDFNDGFATSKQDDCQQGFQPACEWLKGNTK